MLGTVAASIALAVVGLLATPWLVNHPRLRVLLGNAVAKSLGRPVRFGAIGVRGLRAPRVILTDVEVADDSAFHAGALLTLPEVEIRPRLRALLGLRFQVEEVVLVRPVLTVVRRHDGRWNLAGLGRRPEGRPGGPPRGTASGGPGGVTGEIAENRIEHGTVVIELEHGGSVTRYRVEELRGRVSGGGAAATTVDLEGRLEPGALTFRISDGRVGLEGGWALTDTPIQGRLRVEGRQVAALLAPLAGPEVGVSGAVRGAFTLEGTVGHPRLSGEVELPRATVTRRSPRCPEPERRSLVVEAVRLEPRVEDGVLTAPVVGRVGDGRIVASVATAFGEGSEVDVTSLALRNVPLEAVLADFLCERYAVTGPLDLTGRTRFRAGAPWTTLEGWGRLRIGPGRVVGPDALRLAGGLLQVVGLAAAGLDAEVPGVLRSAPLEFESISATYRVARGVIETTDLLYTARRVRARVAGRYALATGKVNADIVVEHRRGEVRARVTGTAAAPVIRISPATLLRAVDRPTVERGVRELLRRLPGPARLDGS